MARTEPQGSLDVDGRSPDPQCLHCALNAPVTAWLAEHPRAKLSAVVGQVLEVAGDLGASGCATPVQLEAFAARGREGRHLDA